MSEISTTPFPRAPAALPRARRALGLCAVFLLSFLVCAQAMPLAEAYREAAAARIPLARALVDQVLADADAANRPVYDLLATPEADPDAPVAAASTSAPSGAPPAQGDTEHGGSSVTGRFIVSQDDLNGALAVIHIGDLMDRATPLARPITMLHVYDAAMLEAALETLDPRLPSQPGDWAYGVLGGAACVGGLTIVCAIMGGVIRRPQRRSAYRERMPARL